MNNKQIAEFIDKVKLLETKVGAKVNYKICKPYSFNPQDIVQVQYEAKRIAQFIGLEHVSFIVAYKTQEKNIGGIIEANPYKNKIFIELNIDMKPSPQAILAALAHEITHQFMYTNGIKGNSTLDTERLTDTTAIFLGLGKFLLNGYSYSFNIQSQVRTGKLGYLSKEEIAFVYKLICAMRKIPDKDSLSFLEQHAVTTIRQIEKNNIIFFDPRFHTGRCFK